MAVASMIPAAPVSTGVLGVAGEPTITRPALATAGTVTLCLAVHANNGSLGTTPEAIVLLTIALVVLLRGIWGPPIAALERAGTVALELLLGVAIAVVLTAHFTKDPALYLRAGGPFRLAPFYGGLAVVGGLVLLAFHRPNLWVRARLVAMLLVYLALGAWILHYIPNPPIDVFVFQRDGAAALLGGQNPYDTTFPDIYGGRSPYYGSGLSANGRVTFGFVYPPLSLLLAIPGHLLGDVRYSHLAAMAIAGFLMAVIRPGLSRVGFLAATLFLFSPRNFLVVSLAWTEPFLVMLLALVAFCVFRKRRGLAVALGLFFVGKQYTVLAVPLLPLLWQRVPHHWAELRRSDFVATTLKAALVGAAVSLPLALWNGRAFWHSVAELQLHQPFRPDALSYSAALARLTGIRLTPVVALLASLATMALVWRRCPRNAEGFCAALAAVYLAFFAFNKQAFCNYYYFVIGALCISIASFAGPRPSEPA